MSHLTPWLCDGRVRRKYVLGVVGTSRCDVRAACSGATPSSASVARTFVPPAATRAGTAQRAIPTIAPNQYPREEGEKSGQGPWGATVRFFACIGTLNLLGDPKRRSSGRTPKPGGCSSTRNQRASVLECGGAPPLSTEWTWHSCGSGRGIKCIAGLRYSGSRVMKI